ncbi:helix-turn-helix transcriptional regulator [Streptomyces sp. NPDC051211]|uniref:helix-turn-helix domain-containing protein n=1 Tax=Streptomyces sp. NPDC051211 TaxID=3154643 RepID=UPI00344D07A8
MASVVEDEYPSDQRGDPTLELRNFGRLIQAFRKKCELKQEDVALLARYSVEYVGSVEQGRRFPSEMYIKRLEDALRTDGVILAAHRDLNSRRGLASWFRRWAELEDTAVSLNTYECRAVPGLLQTEAYARALVRNVPPLPEPEEAEARVAARLARQKLLRRAPYIAFSFIVDQPVIDRQTGGLEVTRELLDHLLECAALPNVDLQIIPTICPEHAGTDGPFQLLETDEHEWLGYAEGQKTGRVLTGPKAISALNQRYAKLRIQALNPADSAGLLMRLRGTL